MCCQRICGHVVVCFWGSDVRRAKDLSARRECDGRDRRTRGMDPERRCVIENMARRSLLIARGWDDSRRTAS